MTFLTRDTGARVIDSSEEGDIFEASLRGHGSRIGFEKVTCKSLRPQNA